MSHSPLCPIPAPCDSSWEVNGAVVRIFHHSSRSYSFSPSSLLPPGPAEWPWVILRALHLPDGSRRCAGKQQDAAALQVRMQTTFLSTCPVKRFKRYQPPNEISLLLLATDVYQLWLVPGANFVTYLYSKRFAGEVTSGTKLLLKLKAMQEFWDLNSFPLS